MCPRFGRLLYNNYTCIVMRHAAEGGKPRTHHNLDGHFKRAIRATNKAIASVDSTLGYKISKV